MKNKIRTVFPLNPCMECQSDHRMCYRCHCEINERHHRIHWYSMMFFYFRAQTIIPFSLFFFLKIIFHPNETVRLLSFSSVLSLSHPHRQFFSSVCLHAARTFYYIRSCVYVWYLCWSQCKMYTPKTVSPRILLKIKNKP